ncbi:hypothetical protein C8Q78DRAFT_1036808 [Trametes maxima]|nr:hypothetical protein C8Q78DRAFT_1036808 [Trametes maxima]
MDATVKDLEVGLGSETPPTIPLASPDGGSISLPMHDSDGKRPVSLAEGDVAQVAPQRSYALVVGRLTSWSTRLRTQASTRWTETYPHVLDSLRRTIRLCGLSLMLIFVVALACFFMALSHWCTIVFGHVLLRYTFPVSVDDTFVRSRLDDTMIFAGIGAFVVNLPQFLVFLLSFPLTFDRTVLEGSTAPANEFVKRITPKNRYALAFMKYAPRLLAGPIGCQIFWFFSGDNDLDETLDPLHATIAGVAGEVALTLLGMLKGRLRRKRPDAATDGVGKEEGEMLPLPTTA